MINQTRSLHNWKADSTRISAAESELVSFWIGFGLGYGSATGICASCGDEGITSGTTANVSLGIGLNTRLFLGLQASVWINDWGIYRSREDKIYRTHFMIVSYYYPWVQSHFFGKLGVGLSAYNAYDRYQPRTQDIRGEDLPSLVHSDGLGVSLTVGHDFKMAGRLSLSPALSYSYGRLGDLVLNDTKVLAEHRPLHLVELNIGLMFRSAD